MSSGVTVSSDAKTVYEEVKKDKKTPVYHISHQRREGDRCWVDRTTWCHLLRLLRETPRVQKRVPLLCVRLSGQHSRRERTREVIDECRPTGAHDLVSRVIEDQAEDVILFLLRRPEEGISGCLQVCPGVRLRGGVSGGHRRRVPKGRQIKANLNLIYYELNLKFIILLYLKVISDSMNTFNRIINWKRNHYFCQTITSIEWLLSMKMSFLETFECL